MQMAAVYADYDKKISPLRIPSNTAYKAFPMQLEKTASLNGHGRGHERHSSVGTLPPQIEGMSYVSTLRRQRATVWSDKSQKPTNNYTEKKRMLKAGMKRMATFSSANSSLHRHSGEQAPQYSTRVPRLSETEAKDSDDEDDCPLQPQDHYHDNDGTKKDAWPMVDTGSPTQSTSWASIGDNENVNARMERAKSCVSVVALDERTLGHTPKGRLFIANPDLPEE